MAGVPVVVTSSGERASGATVDAALLDACSKFVVAQVSPVVAEGGAVDRVHGSVTDRAAGDDREQQSAQFVAEPAATRAAGLSDEHRSGVAVLALDVEPRQHRTVTVPDVMQRQPSAARERALLDVGEHAVVVDEPDDLPGLDAEPRRGRVDPAAAIEHPVHDRTA